MMKNNYFFKRTLSAVVMLMASSFMWASDFEVDGIFYNFNEDGKSVEVTYYDDGGNNRYSGDIVIPSIVTYEGKTYSVTSIGNGAFGGCSSLTSVEIPNSVTNIGYSVFRDCSSLTSIIVADDNPVYDSREGCNAIIETASNTLIAGYQNTVIPNSVTSIGNFAFDACYSLTSVEIPNSVTSIGYSAFYRCYSLTSIEIPNSVTSIGGWAFGYCSALTSVEIPNSVTSIGYSAFDGCSALTSVEIPNSVTSIGEYAFGYCSALTSVEIPNSVTSIGGWAFNGCRSLTSIEIPNSVTSIGEYTFGYCSALTSVEIPNSVTSIGYSAFSGCSSLTTVICHAEEVPSLGEGVFSFVSTSEVTLYVPASAIEAYKAANQWKYFGTILPIDEDAMGISSTEAGQETDATYYTLDGVSVKNPTKKGIYIKNGKKILFR